MLKIHRVFSIHKTTGHVMDYENVQFIDAASIDTKLKAKELVYAQHRR